MRINFMKYETGHNKQETDRKEAVEGDILYVNEYMDYDAIDKSARRRSDLIKTMSSGCDVLEELGAQYWLARGSVLGFHRENGFLSTDIDIDLDVYGDRDIHRIIKKLPFEPLFFSINKGHYQQCAFLDPENDVIFDIFFYYEKGNVLTNRNYFGYYWLPAELPNNIQSFNFEGRNYPIPNPDWYCEFWYGKNWKTPKTYGKDWSIDYRNDCHGFIYTGAQNIVQTNYY